jgi:hypothetical protein
VAGGCEAEQYAATISRVGGTLDQASTLELVEPVGHRPDPPCVSAERPPHRGARVLCVLQELVNRQVEHRFGTVGLLANQLRGVMADTKASPPIHVATTTFVAAIDGDEHYVRTGDKLRADHPAVAAHPKFFREALDTD